MSPDAIIAVATAPGRGGIGVIRISIPSSHGQSVDGAFAKSGSEFGAASDAGASALHHLCQTAFSLRPKPRFAHLVRLRDEHSQVIDEGVLLYFPAPASFTGEHVIEFQGHGGPALLKLCVEQIIAIAHTMSQTPEFVGFALRLARPGEFTERAFLNGKLDLAQAEAVADLIDAGSSRAARAAMSSLQGRFSSDINQLADTLLQLRLLVEATLDFPEEEIEFLKQSDALGRLSSCRMQLDAMQKQARASAKLASGLRIVIAGEPNVGKSSLLNALSGEDRAIVTDIAGTTRDAIHQDIELDGIRVTLIDTAGLRQTDDPVERIGIERTLKEIEQADLLLVMVDASLSQPVLPQALAHIAFTGPRLRVANKVDLLGGAKPHDSVDAYRSSSALSFTSGPEASVAVSAKTGAGLEQLRSLIFSTVECDPHADLPYLARERHLHALRRAAVHLELAQFHGDQADASLDLFAEELRLAHDALGEITGRVLPDDLLGLIFSRFCIGK